MLLIVILKSKCCMTKTNLMNLGSHSSFNKFNFFVYGSLITVTPTFSERFITFIIFHTYVYSFRCITLLTFLWTCRKILQSLTLAYGQMILKSGFFHADPHPGNILICKGSEASHHLNLFSFSSMLFYLSMGDILLLLNSRCFNQEESHMEMTLG